MGTTLKTVYCRGMNKTTQNQTYTDPCTYAMQSDMNRLKEEIASDLANYMLEMMPDCLLYTSDAADDLRV